MPMRRIRYRLLAVIGFALALGFAATALFYMRHAERAILDDQHAILHRLTEAVIPGIETVMENGHVEIARDYAQRLKKIRGVSELAILRADGTEAFVDNRTIREVESYSGQAVIAPRAKEEPRTVLAADDARLAQARAGAEALHWFETDANGERFARMLDPIFNRESCHGCHDPAQRVRGMVLVSMSMAAAERDILDNRIRSLIVLAGALAATLMITGFALGRTVVRPLERVTDAMREVSSGELERRIPEVSRDELGTMARSFNEMLNNLSGTYGALRKERDKLTTIIFGAQEAIVVTDAAGDIVLVNPAAETVLGKPAERIVREGFAHLLDDPDAMARLLDERRSGATEVIAYRDSALEVAASTIRDPAGKVIGSAALLRDITEEKRLEAELRRLSQTDALTGLHNRRYFDEALAAEYARARQTGTPLALLMVDVDHFKRFNDEYGHEQGDRVLRAVAGALPRALRRYDVACRYGGEEMTVVLPATDASGALAVAERLRCEVSAVAVDGLGVTVSIGVAVLTQGAGPQSADELMRAADGALYAAKRAGRNRVALAGAEADDA